MGSHMTYKVHVILYKIIVLVIHWPVIVSKLCKKNFKYKYRFIKMLK